MNIYRGFDERLYREIAKSTGNKQLVEDVKYMRITQHFRPQTLVAERLDDVAFYIGYFNADHFRLVGIGVRKEKQGKGYGRFMLCRAKEFVKQNGYKKIKTRTLNGVDFYQKWGGARITGMQDNDFLMEMDV